LLSVTVIGPGPRPCIHWRGRQTKGGTVLTAVWADGPLSPAQDLALRPRAAREKGTGLGSDPEPSPTTQKDRSAVEGSVLRPRATGERTDSRMAQERGPRIILRHKFDAERDRNTALHNAVEYIWELYSKLELARLHFQTYYHRIGGGDEVFVNLVTGPVYEMAANIMMHGNGGTIEVSSTRVADGKSGLRL